MKLYYWRKIYIIYHRLEEITPLVTDVKSYIYIYITDWKKLRR